MDPVGLDGRRDRRARLAGINLVFCATGRDRCGLFDQLPPIAPAVRTDRQFFKGRLGQAVALPKPGGGEKTAVTFFAEIHGAPLFVWDVEAGLIAFSA